MTDDWLSGACAQYRTNNDLAEDEALVVWAPDVAEEILKPPHSVDLRFYQTEPEHHDDAAIKVYIYKTGTILTLSEDVERRLTLRDR